MTIFPGVVIGWKQTAEERYGTDVNERAHAVIEAISPIAEIQGGCWMLTKVVGESELRAHEYVLVEHVTLADLAALRARLEVILGNPETLTIEAEGKAGVNIA